jgi:hypothetical protein
LDSSKDVQIELCKNRTERLIKEGMCCYLQGNSEEIVSLNALSNIESPRDETVNRNIKIKKTRKMNDQFSDGAGLFKISVIGSLGLRQSEKIALMSFITNLQSTIQNENMIGLYNSFFPTDKGSEAAKFGRSWVIYKITQETVSVEESLLLGKVLAIFSINGSASNIYAFIRRYHDLNVRDLAKNPVIGESGFNDIVLIENVVRSVSVVHFCNEKCVVVMTNAFRKDVKSNNIKYGKVKHDMDERRFVHNLFRYY